eukprot:NODE_11933_length_245_cov_80.750000_g10163_i0.p2 GENE.NODE_11933_length_245_cov_80.750000_g10163_i0~~NODE_11933_length_245_cov_80.750000_g10163_i0.p2  ORF type:complete len:54 (+),score=1.99 NODE_11933_length_245_cov_80.750000_g10163_i0:67-228(+)
MQVVGYREHPGQRQSPAHHMTHSMSAPVHRSRGWNHIRAVDPLAALHPPCTLR